MLFKKTLLAGMAAAAAACSDADVKTLRAGDYALQIETAGAGSLRAEHAGRNIGQVNRIFDYQIAHGTARAQCTAQNVRVTGAGPRYVTLAGDVDCAEGSRFEGRARLESTKTAGEFSVSLAAAKVQPGSGAGLAQRLSVELAGTDKVEGLLPGVWYKGNEHVEDCGPNRGAGRTFHVREDRVTYPAVSVRNASFGVSLFRDGAAVADAEPKLKPADTKLLLAGNLVYGGARGGTDIAGVGFDLGGGGAPASVTLQYPFHEGPYSQQLRVNAAELTPIFDRLCRYDPVWGFNDWGQVRKTGLASAWRVAFTRHEDFGALMSYQWMRAAALYAPQPFALANSSPAIREALAQFVAGRYDDSSAVAGFTYVMSVPSGHTLLPYFEPGFTGRGFLNARLLLESGRRFGKPAWIAMAQNVFDTWIANGQNGGAFYDLWDARKNRAASDSSLDKPPENFAIRREAETLWALLQAIEAEAKRGIDRAAWRDEAKRHLDRLVTLQQADGRFCRRYKFSGTCADKNAGGTSAALVPLVYGFRMFNEPAYLAGAKRAGLYVRKNFIAPADYYASTTDNPSENKEAATYAFFAMRLLCEEFCSAGEDEWLSSAVLAADASLTWIQMTDVPWAPTPSPATLHDVGFQTRGLGNIAAGGGNADPYAFEFPGSLLWLAKETGDERYEQMAALIVSAVMSAVAMPGDMKGMALVGMVPEGIQKTLFSYFTGGKGSYAPFAALGWTTASVWLAMDEIETVSGQSTDEFLASLRAGRSLQK